MKPFAEKILCIAIVFSAVLCLYASNAYSATTNQKRAALVRFADRIIENQLPDGAIVMGDPTFPPFTVIPYFSNLASFGLIRAYEMTNDIQYLEGAQRWILWYLDHRNPDGTIYDFTGTEGNWIPTYDYDSTDSYASTFLVATQRILQYVNADTAQLILEAVPNILDAALLTLQPNDLTLAKPGYDIAYSEDNAEVYCGLIAASNTPGWDRSGSIDPAVQASETLNAIETLLYVSKKPAHYLIGLQPDGYKEDITSWYQWYPDQQAQLMLIAWLPKNSRRTSLFSYMKTKLYSSLPSIITTEDDFDKTVWWAMAAKNMGNNTVVNQLINRLVAYKPNEASYNVGLNGHACRILADSLPLPPELLLIK